MTWIWRRKGKPKIKKDKLSQYLKDSDNKTTQLPKQLQLNKLTIKTGKKPGKT